MNKMAFFNVVSFLVLLMLVAQTSQKAHHHANPAMKDKDCKDKNLHGLSVMIDDLAIPDCGMEASYSKFTGDMKPLFYYSNADKNKLYLIIMYVGDTPGCKDNLKYVIGDINGDNLAKGYTSDGVVIAVYNKPDEIQADGKTHKYFIYVYEQKWPLAGAATPTEDRCKFERHGYSQASGLKQKAGLMFKIIAK